MSYGLQKIENQLILHLLRENPLEDKINPLLDHKIDWDYLIKTASKHFVPQLIFKNIKDNFASKIPEDVFTKLKSRYNQNSIRNLSLSGQVIKIIKSLQKQDIDILTYKGMTLAQLAYKNTSLRRFGDIDVFIRKNDFPKIKEALTKLGCRPAWDLTEKQEKAVLKHSYEYPFIVGEINTLLEVHWDFIESFFAFDYNTKSIWERTQTVNIFGKEIPTLSSEDYLIILCSHGSKHFWERLSWICDIARLIENTEIDWDWVIKRANQVGSLRMVWLGLWIAGEVLAAQMPSEIDKKVSAEPEIESLGRKFIANLFNENKEKPDWKEMAKNHIKMREKFRHKFIYSKRLFTTKAIDSLFMPMGRPQ